TETFGMIEGFPLEAERLRFWFSFGPALMPVSVTVCAPASSSITRVGIGSIVGGSLTGFTITWKIMFEVNSPSLTDTVMGAAPYMFGSGVKRSTAVVSA